MVDKKFVGFFDILGFKDLIKNNELSYVDSIIKSVFFDSTMISCLSSMITGDSSIRENIKISEGAVIDVENNDINIHIMSDSVIAWTNTDSFEDFEKILNYCTWLFQLSLLQGLPLRGAISHGEISVLTKEISGTIQKNVFGKAIVNAYELESVQQLAGVIVDRKCITIFPNSHQLLNEIKTRDDIYMTEYNMPLKSGIKKSIVVNWTLNFKEDMTIDDFYSLFLNHNKTLPSEKEKQKVKNTFAFYSRNN